ncbi:MAG: ISNCY family transposase [Nanoarchaeota archaeon]|nr:ISNCY family transposase [Nanoarchaeota archaeon]
MKISTKEVREVVSLLDDIIEKYKKETVEKKRNWRTYEQRLTERIKGAVRDLEPLIDEAVSSIKIVNGETRGRKPELSLKQKVILILVHRLVGKSNRGMSCMLALFSLLSGVDVSYKTVERLYSEDLVILVLHNLHILILRRKGVENVKGSGDGTGYSLTIKKHYASEAQKLKDKLKKNSPEQKVSVKKKKGRKKRQFAYCFKLMDIDTRMYVAYGSSLKSEDEAYQQALDMLKELDLKIDLNSLRLDKYYSKQQYVKQIEEKFGNVKMYLIPKKNATVKGSWKWKRMLHKFVNKTTEYLKEYFQRNNSENGFSEDKRRLGWKLAQKREDRIDTAIFCNQLWHNLFWLN